MDRLQRWYVRWVVVPAESGQGLMEYALVISLVAIIMVIIIGIYGEEVRDLYQYAIDRLPFFD